MTSEQVMLTLMVAVLTMSGCIRGSADPDGMAGAYDERQLWAVAPLRNESGHSYADGLRMADQLAQQFENARGIDVIPVNRVIAAMDAMQMSAVETAGDARRLRQTLGADGLVLGTMTAYEPYDPPKIGLAIELYLDPLRPSHRVDSRRLTRAAVDEQTRSENASRANRPTSAVSAFYDANDPQVREHLEDYARERGREAKGEQTISAALYRTSIDLYSEFVAHEAASRLLLAEHHRRIGRETIAAGEP